MTREVTDQLYIDLGYFNPEDYYTYQAEAQIAQASQATMSVTVGVIKQTNCAMNTQFSVTATISHIEGADLFAFANAQLSAQVSAIKQNNVQMASNFSVACDAVRGIYISAQADSVVNMSTANLRVRYNEAAVTAAFSISVDATIAKNASASLSSQATTSISVERYRYGSAGLSSQATLTAIATRSLIVSSNINSQASLSGSFGYQSRPTIITSYNGGEYTGIYPSATQSKFGGYSLFVEKTNATSYYPRTFRFNGTDFKGFDNGYTWTSTDGQTWSRNTNNLTSGIVTNSTKITWDGTRYLFNKNGTLYASTDGLTWTTSNKTTQTNNEFIDYYGGNYYISRVIPNGSFYDIYIYRSSTWNGTYSQVFTAGYTSSFGYISGTFNTGSRIGYIFNTDGAYATRIIHSATGASNSWTNTVKTNINTIEFGNGVYVATWSDGTTSKLQKSTDLSTWSDVTNGSGTWSEVVYKGSRWFASKSNDLYSATSIDSLSLVSSYVTRIEFGNSLYVAYRKYSSNGTTWNTITSNNSINLRGYIEYFRGDNSDLGQFKTLDFWYYHTTNNSVFPLLQQQGATIVRILNNRVEVTNSTKTLSTPVNSLSSGWNHIRISIDGSSAAIYINGSRQLYDTTLTGWVYTSNPIMIAGELSFYPAGSSSINDSYIDELLVSDELLTSPTTTSFSVPTGQYTTNPNVDLLLHFNNTIEDDSYVDNVIRTASASLTSTSSISALGGKIIGVSCSMSSNFTQTADFKKSVEASASIQSQGFLVAAFGRIRPFVDISASEFTLGASAIKTSVANAGLNSQASVSCQVTKTFGEVTINQNSNFNITAIAQSQLKGQAGLEIQGFVLAAVGRIRPEVADLTTTATMTINAQKVVVSSGVFTSQFTQTSDITKVFGPITANLSALAALTAQVQAIPSGSVVMSSAFAVTAINDRLRSFDSAQSALANLSAQGQLTRRLASTISAQFNITATVIRVKQFAASLPVIASELAAVSKIGRTLVDCVVVSQMALSARITSGSASNLDSTTALTASVGVIKPTSLVMTSTTMMVTQAEAGIIAGAQLQVTAQLSATGRQVKVARATITCQASVVAAGRVIRSAIILQASSGTMTVNVRRLRRVESNPGAQFTLVGQITKVVGFRAQLQCQGFLLSTGKVINLDASATWIVPKETRAWNIAYETRGYIIAYENRLDYIKED